eukprot:351841-Chlamydomonas_euryale.AAC.22
MSWSASEYLYLMLLLNDTRLPPEALFLLRHQRFFSLTNPASGAYRQLLSPSDEEMLPLLASFQQLCQYRRVALPPDAALTGDERQRYYNGLIEKYIGPGKLARAAGEGGAPAHRTRRKLHRALQARVVSGTASKVPRCCRVRRWRRTSGSATAAALLNISPGLESSRGERTAAQGSRCCQARCCPLASTLARQALLLSSKHARAV